MIAPNFRASVEPTHSATFLAIPTKALVTVEVPPSVGRPPGRLTAPRRPSRPELHEYGRSGVHRRGLPMASGVEPTGRIVTTPRSDSQRPEAKQAPPRRSRVVLLREACTALSRCIGTIAAFGDAIDSYGQPVPAPASHKCLAVEQETTGTALLRLQELLPSLRAEIEPHLDAFAALSRGPYAFCGGSWASGAKAVLYTTFGIVETIMLCARDAEGRRYSKESLSGRWDEIRVLLLVHYGYEFPHSEIVAAVEIECARLDGLGVESGGTGRKSPQVHSSLRPEGMPAASLFDALVENIGGAPTVRMKDLVRATSQVLGRHAYAYSETSIRAALREHRVASDRGRYDTQRAAHAVAVELSKRSRRTPRKPA